MTDATIRISKELREFLGAKRSHPRESYDMLLRRKLHVKRSRKIALKSRILPKLTPGKATRAVLGSDSRATRVVLDN